jgi:hypothetical protein
MSKYQDLNRFFSAQTAKFLPMTFDEVQREAGFALPTSARLHQAWWANDHVGHVQARAWLDAGYETEQVDMSARKLVFKRVEVGSQPSGMSETAIEFKHEGETEKKSRRSPLFGCMKGTFWIDPEWDLTKPTLSDEEMAEWDASLDRKAALYEEGRSRKPR